MKTNGKIQGYRNSYLLFHFKGKEDKKRMIARAMTWYGAVYLGVYGY